MMKLFVLLALALASIVLAIMDDFVPDNARIVCKIGMIIAWLEIIVISIIIVV